MRELSIIIPSLESCHVSNFDLRAKTPIAKTNTRLKFKMSNLSAVPATARIEFQKPSKLNQNIKWYAISTSNSDLTISPPPPRPIRCSQPLHFPAADSPLSIRMRKRRLSGSWYGTAVGYFRYCCYCLRLELLLKSSGFAAEFASTAGAPFVGDKPGNRSRQRTGRPRDPDPGRGDLWGRPKSCRRWATLL